VRTARDFSYAKSRRHDGAPNGNGEAKTTAARSKARDRTLPIHNKSNCEGWRPEDRRYKIKSNRNCK
jgi:hypothetical protein